MFDRLKKVGGEFAFYTAVEFERPNIIKGLQKWMGAYKIQDFQKMLIEGQMPAIDPNLSSVVAPYAKYLVKFTAIDLMEAIGEASPAVFQLIQDNGETGAAYLIKLRKHLIDSCTRPAQAAAGPEMVKCTCETCQKTWLVEKSKVSEVVECPFCHEPAK